MENCRICRKEISDFEGVVYYSKIETHLCRKHYREWMKFHKPYMDSHKHIKPTTQEWYDMCEEQEKLLMEWLKTKIPKTDFKDIVAKINTCSALTLLGKVVLEETDKMLSINNINLDPSEQKT